jgi:chromate reductase
MIKILGIAGSLRKDSFHKAVLRAAAEHAPSNAAVEIFDGLGGINLYNQDEENRAPKSVVHLKEKVRSSDAILFATPEYNYSVPGVLKNAIDWASRPYGDSAWNGKPAAIMTASVGTLGGSRAQYHLRQTFVFLNMFPLNQPEVIIPEIQNKVDRHGKVIDKHTIEKISEQLRALVAWTIKLQTRAASPAEPSEKYPYHNAYGRAPN